MNKKQIILVSAATLLLAAMYFLGPTIAPIKKDAKPATNAVANNNHQHFDMESYVKTTVAALQNNQQQYLSMLEAQVKRGDVKEQALHAKHQLAAFWKDSVPNPLMHFYYQSSAADLENTEKSLTFAAHSILGYLPFVQNADQQHWLADRGKQLFESVLKINSANDSAIVGVGGTIMYGAHSNGGPMDGILKVREVAERDSTQIFAQYMLGVGGLISQQYEKALPRFEKVVKAQPNNLDALFKLAETCELLGQKQKAAYWYEQIVAKVKEPSLRAELKKRINQLKS